VVLERSALALAAGARLETFTPFTALAAAFFTGCAGLWLLAEIFASLLLAELLAEALDLAGRLVAFDGRLADFVGAFLRVDMADLLLKPSASGMRQVHGRCGSVTRSSIARHTNCGQSRAGGLIALTELSKQQKDATTLMRAAAIARLWQRFIRSRFSTKSMRNQRRRPGASRRIA
jgi:hypothetical protein